MAVPPVMVHLSHWGAFALPVAASLVLAATYIGCSNSTPTTTSPTDTGTVDTATDTGKVADDTGSVDSTDTGGSVDDTAIADDTAVDDTGPVSDANICENGEACDPLGATCTNSGGMLCKCDTYGTGYAHQWSCP